MSVPSIRSISGVSAPFTCRLFLISIACLALRECTTNTSLRAAELPWIVVNTDRTGFVQRDSTTPFRPSGFNYDHDSDGRLLEDYWHSEWSRIEEDFREMKELGASVIRVHLQFGKFMESPTQPREAEVRQYRTLLDLAQKTGLYLDVTGLGCYHKADVPEWYDALDEADRWEAQACFWECIAAAGADNSAIFCYDLMNEPVIGGETPSESWLGPPFAGKHFVQFVARETRGRTRSEAARQWTDRMVRAVRRHDSRHLITVGLVDWSLERPGLTSGFVPDKVTNSLDFIAVHLYPKSSQVDEAIDTLRGFSIGKPIVIEETFPLQCSREEMSRFMDLTKDLTTGWVSFYWGKSIEDYADGTTITDAIMRQWLMEFSGRMKSQAVQTAASVRSPVVERIADHGIRHAHGQAAFSADLDAWKGDTRNLPIGVFDSGIGGLTVLEAILEADTFNNATLQPEPDGRPDFGGEQFIYLGDQANMPYGNYPSAKQEEYLKELILKDAVFLLGRRYWQSVDADGPRFDKPPVKAIVIACNTATAWGLDEIRELVERWNIPIFVIGVVEAGARGVLELTPSENDSRRTVAVLATTGTCNSKAYPRAIEKALGQAGRLQALIVQQGSVGLAGAIEGDKAFAGRQNTTDSGYSGPSLANDSARLDPALWDAYQFDQNGLLGQSDNNVQLNSVDNYIRYDVTTLVETWKRQGGNSPIDTVVLGCTHFPLVRSELLAEFERLRTLEVNGHRPYANLIAEHPSLVDPASLTARELFRELAAKRLFASGGPDEARPHQFYMSVPNTQSDSVVLNPDGTLDRAYKYGRHPGRLELEDTIVVPMTPELLPEASRNLVQTRLPRVWSELSSLTP